MDLFLIDVIYSILARKAKVCSQKPPLVKRPVCADVTFVKNCYVLMTLK